MLQTILGANGVIGDEIARELHRRKLPLRLVSRTPRALNLGESLFAANLLNEQATSSAVEGSSVVYLTAGLPYDIRLWRAQWPVIIKNVLLACRKHQARLVFFDNVYMYGPVNGWMTEQTPMNPTSAKGKVRAQIATALLNAAAKGDIDVRIARSADFYGPNALHGLPNFLIFDHLAKGKRPQWFVSGDHRHSMTYTLDAALGTVELGLRDSLPGDHRLWHLPTDDQAMTAEDWVKKAAAAMKTQNPKPLQLLKPWMVRAAGIFQHQILEIHEMLYQYDRDYLFSSKAFEEGFSIRPTPYSEGIEATASAQLSK